jgi:thioredoxin 1
MDNIIQLTELNFDQVIEQHRLLLIDFAADWCAPCKSLAKVIDKVAEHFPEFTFARVDIEAEKKLAEEFAVKTIPSVMILRDQVVVFMESGAMSELTLKELLHQTKALSSDHFEKRSDNT